MAHLQRTGAQTDGRGPRREISELARLPHISTADTARDLDHLRALLGEEKLN